MDKCEGCPMNCPECAFEYAHHPDWIHCTQKRELDDCHLTPSDMDAIRKAIAGEGRLVCMRQEEYETGVWLSGLMQTNLHQQEREGE